MSDLSNVDDIIIVDSEEDSDLSILSPKKTKSKKKPKKFKKVFKKTYNTRSKCKHMISTIKSNSNYKKKSKSKSKSNSMDIDDSDSDEDFDIDDDNDTPSPKKIVLKRNNKKKIIDNRPLWEQSSESELDPTPTSSTQSPFTSLIKQSSTKNPSSKRSKFLHFKNKIEHKNSSDLSDDYASSDSLNSNHNNNNKVSGKKRKTMYDSESDVSKEEYDQFGLHQSDYVSNAIQYKDKEYDGTGLELFYKNTLGIDSSSDSLECIEPANKKRKLSDYREYDINGNLMISNLKKQQKSQSFGGLPVSQDIMIKIATFLTINDVSVHLVIINREFYKCFNTDIYWRVFINQLISDGIITLNQKNRIKSFKIGNNNKLWKNRLLFYFQNNNDLDDIDPFHVLLHKYILQLKYIENDPFKRHKFYIDRAFLIRLYLVKECGVMWYNNKNNKKNTKEQVGIVDTVYQFYHEFDSLKIILPQKHYNDIYKQFNVFLYEKYRNKLDNRQSEIELYNRFASEWLFEQDVVSTYRYTNQLYIEYKSNAMRQDTMKDLNSLNQLRNFYLMSNNTTAGLVNCLCNTHTSEFNDIAHIVSNRVIKVDIQSPSLILDEVFINIMEFINQFNNNNELECKLNHLYDEMCKRKLVSNKKGFNSLLEMLDENVFSFSNDFITYTAEY